MLVLAAGLVWVARWDRGDRSEPIASVPIPGGSTDRGAQAPAVDPEGDGGGGGAPAVDPPSAPSETEPWYPEYRAAITWILADDQVWNPLQLHRVADVTSPYVNVEDGIRSSWRAPPCSCRRLTVWMYGGSTTFGLGQRDEHTIASELARLAHADGMAVDVINKGQPGQAHLLEAIRFSWDVTGEPPPDLVVFYDGGNEIWATEVLRTAAEAEQPTDPLLLEYGRGLEERYPQRFDRPEGIEVPEPEPLPSDLSAYAFARLAIERYERARQVSQAIASANEIPVVYLWQPSVFSSPSQRPDDDEAWRERYLRTEAMIPEGVVDLTGVFDDVTAPLFTDRVHHDERGARLVAAEAYRHLRPQLEGS